VKQQYQDYSKQRQRNAQIDKQKYPPSLALFGFGKLLLLFINL